MSGVRKKQCQAAEAALPQVVKRSLSGAMDPVELLPYKSSVLAYDRACLYSWCDLRPQTRSAVDKFIAALFLRKDGRDILACAAFRIDDHHVVTARHCLWSNGIGLDPRQLSIRLLVVPTRVVHPTGAEQLNDIEEAQLGDFDDYVILRVDTSYSPLDADPASFSPQMPYVAQLIVPDLSDYSYTLRQRENIEKWTEALRVDKNGACSRQPIAAAGEHTQRCIYTRCQTAPSMSGAPMFSYDPVQHRFFIGGIHLRSGSLLGQGSRRECGDRKDFNVGITLPGDVLHIAQSGNRKTHDPAHQVASPAGNSVH